MKLDIPEILFIIPSTLLPGAWMNDWTPWHCGKRR
jgi:hypothetical protein